MKLFIRDLAGCLDLLAPVQTTYFHCSITSHWSIQRIPSEYKLAIPATTATISKQASPALLWSTPKPINLQFLLYLLAFNKMLQSDALVDAELLHSNLLSSICILPSSSQNINILPGTPSYVCLGPELNVREITEEYNPLCIIRTLDTEHCSIKLSCIFYLHYPWE